MATRADLIIVGAGLAGSAAAWAASARGLDVVVLEAFGPGHAYGSSHGSARIFRRAYPDPLYVRLTGTAGELWRQLEDQAGQPLLTLTGGLDFGAARNPRLLHEVLASCGVPAELLPPEEAARRWPYFDFGGAGEVMFHAGAGVLDPHNAMAAMLALATERGADVRFGTPVTRLEPTASGDGAVAHTDSGAFAAPVIAVAAGAWLAPLLAGVVDLPPLTVTQQQVFHFAPRALPRGPWPVFVYKDGTDDCYGLAGGRDGEVPGAVKVGEHAGFTPATAAARDFTVNPAARARITDFIGRRIPGLDPGVVNETTCLYTWTANEDFILDRRGPFVVASPCSGHGAKFAPLTGEIIADLVTGKPAANPRFTLAAHRVTRA
ncbi:MAG TPA: FAD-dependent oxidoreductase [Trebonia sp.]|nr:FAD-dependent oxidoreductase [Trebonia sp.]